MVCAETGMGSKITALQEPERKRETAELHDRCGIFTQDSTAREMLGSIGWTEQEDLSRARLLDPCIGEGAFIVPAVETLIASLKRTGTPLTRETLAGRILGLEIHGPAFARQGKAVGSALLRIGRR
jgi:hypothetical protein